MPSLQLPQASSDLLASPPSGAANIYPSWQSHDPRSSSTMSLVPSPEDDEQRRTLLMIYIHGFMGNDASFHSFPAHVHHFLEETLANTHVVHTKIYPRYKTYKAIDVARDNFSKWLEPHESPETDVILLGHSMGGLLSADIVLMVGAYSYGFHAFPRATLDQPCSGTATRLTRLCCHVASAKY